MRVLSLLTFFAIASINAQFILSKHWLGSDSCEGNFTSLSLTVATCQPGLGDYGGRPFGFVSGQNATHYFVDQCTDSQCQNCSFAYALRTGCYIYEGEEPYYPGEADFVAIVSSVPSIPSGYSITYYYSQEGCSEDNLMSINAYDHVCRTIRGQSNGYFCNATTSSQSGCTANATVYSQPTGTCLSNSGRSTRYFCNEGAAYSCSTDFDCRPFSQDYNFAQCSNSQCACRSGFSGSATANDQCRCDGTVVYNNGQASCLTERQCTADRIDLCSAYTENYTFIQCSNGSCACKPGFAGSATATDKCRCSGTVEWSNGNPTCRT